jgi:F0F1-type ATP synthase membrane subunit b/b'
MDYKPAPQSQIVEELEDTKSRLAAAELVIDKLAAPGGEFDDKAKELIAAAIMRVEAMMEDGRKRVTQLVQDAEQLHAIADRQVKEAEDRARQSVLRQTSELVDNARRLEEQASEKAALIIEEAQKRATEIETEIDSRLAEAEKMYRKVENHIAGKQQVLDEVRKKADQIIRNAKVTAAEIQEDAVESARKTSQAARIEAANLIRAAKDEARIQLDRITAQERDAKERLERARSHMAG